MSMEHKYWVSKKGNFYIHIPPQLRHWISNVACNNMMLPMMHHRFANYSLTLTVWHTFEWMCDALCAVCVGGPADYKCKAHKISSSINLENQITCSPDSGRRPKDSLQTEWMEESGEFPCLYLSHAASRNVFFDSETWEQHQLPPRS